MWSRFVQVPPITLPKTNVAPEKSDPSFLEISILSFENAARFREAIHLHLVSLEILYINIKHHVTNEVHQDRQLSKRMQGVVLNYKNAPLTSQQRTRAGLATCGEFKLDIHGEVHTN